MHQIKYGKGLGSIQTERINRHDVISGWSNVPKCFIWNLTRLTSISLICIVQKITEILRGPKMPIHARAIAEACRLSHVRMTFNSMK